MKPREHEVLSLVWNAGVARDRRGLQTRPFLGMGSVLVVAFTRAVSPFISFVLF